MSQALLPAILGDKKDEKKKAQFTSWIRKCGATTIITTNRNTTGESPAKSAQQPPPAARLAGSSSKGGLIRRPTIDLEDGNDENALNMKGILRSKSKVEAQAAGNLEDKKVLKNFGVISLSSSQSLACLVMKKSEFSKPKAIELIDISSDDSSRCKEFEVIDLSSDESSVASRSGDHLAAPKKSSVPQGPTRSAILHLTIESYFAMNSSIPSGCLEQMSAQTVAVVTRFFNRQTTASTTPPVFTVSCTQCERQFIDHTQLMAHLQFDHNSTTGWESCVICDVKMQHKSTLKGHVKIMHGKTVIYFALSIFSII